MDLLTYLLTYVMPGICIFVLLSVGLSVSNLTQKLLIFMKIVPEMHQWTRKNRLHFASPLPLDLHSSALCNGHFSTFLAYISGKTGRILQNFTQAYLWTRKSPWNFGNHPATDADMNVEIRIQTGFYLGRDLRCPSADCIFVVFFDCYKLVNAFDFMENLVSEMTCYVSSLILNSAHSLTQYRLENTFVVFV